MNRLDVLTMTSHFEGEPVVFLEAMASGALCSFRDVGECSQLLDGRGMMTQPIQCNTSDDEIDHMAANIIGTLKKSVLCHRMAVAARERIELKHSNGSWGDNFQRMMEDILK
jgi:glycosyltransferase involved in cell wall biosynthesis